MVSFISGRKSSVVCFPFISYSLVNELKELNSQFESMLMRLTYMSLSTRVLSMRHDCKESHALYLTPLEPAARARETSSILPASFWALGNRNQPGLLDSAALTVLH